MCLNLMSILGPSNPKRSRIIGDESKQPEVTSSPLKFTTLLRELSSKVSAVWEDIGLCLELEQGHLDTIKSDHQQSKKCFREMLKLWLKQVEPPPRWSAIIDAIEVLEYKSLAEDLRKKYILTIENTREYYLAQWRCIHVHVHLPSMVHVRTVRVCK